MGQWLIEQGLATEEALEEMGRETRNKVERIRRQAWQAFMAPVRAEVAEVSDMLDKIAGHSHHTKELGQIQRRLNRFQYPNRKGLMGIVRDALILLRDEPDALREELVVWKKSSNAMATPNHITGGAQINESAITRAEPTMLPRRFHP